MSQLEKIFLANVLLYIDTIEDIINIGFNNVLDEIYATYDLFSDIIAEKKENNLFKTVANIKNRYGKNSILKGVSFNEKATARERNKMIGGHNGGEDE